MFAANSLLGFNSWQEKVCYIYALLNLLPPVKEVKACDQVSEFRIRVLSDHGLIAKLRINTVRNIAYILGRDSSHASSFIKPHGLRHRERLGIFINPSYHITEDFLRETCPQAFIEEGVDKILWV